MSRLNKRCGGVAEGVGSVTYDLGRAAAPGVRVTSAGRILAESFTGGARGEAVFAVDVDATPAVLLETPGCPETRGRGRRQYKGLAGICLTGTLPNLAWGG